MPPLLLSLLLCKGNIKMITVDIDGAQVPVNMIKSWGLREEEKYFGGQTSTLQIEYYSNNRCHHHVTITGKDAISSYHALMAAVQNQHELEKIEDAIKHLEYDLKELEKTKLEKLNAYGSLLIKRKYLLKI